MKKKVDWSYHRPGCETCAKTKDFLAAHKIEPAKITDAKKTRYEFAEAKAMLDGVKDLYAMRGQKVVHLNLRSGLPSDAELQAAIIGPSGKLRAPIVRSGTTLIIGFDERLYQEAFG